MDPVKRTVARAKADAKREQELERKANESDAARTEQPTDTPR